MPGPDELARFDRLKNAPANNVVPPLRLPDLPADFVARFPSMGDWKRQADEELAFWSQQQLGIATQGPA